MKKYMGRFIKLDHLLLQHPAFETLTGRAVKLFLYVYKRFNGTNNGQISFSVREAAALLRCSKDTAATTFQELVDHRLLEPTAKGAFSLKVRHATAWRITIEHMAGRAATNDYAHWQPTARDDPPERTATTTANLEHGTVHRTVGPSGRTVRSDNVAEFTSHGPMGRTVRP